MAAAKACPKCDGRMEDGFVVDHSYGEKHVAGWQSGKPVKK